jgi:hypothetical protein
LYDANNTVIGSGETVVDSFPREEQTTVAFTWRTPFVETPSVIKVFPIINPF